jgi:hypothetical protein
MLSAMPGSGRGLLGLPERVSLHGGELEAGSQACGGWRLRAQLPDQPPPIDRGAIVTESDRTPGHAARVSSSPTTRP